MSAHSPCFFIFYPTSQKEKKKRNILVYGLLTLNCTVGVNKCANVCVY